VSGRIQDKVAFVTGAARGQGRSHAIRMAQEGADIIAVDVCGRVESIPYELSTEDDLQRVAKEIESLGRRVVTAKADVRNIDQLGSALDEGVSKLGRLDIVSANAGVYSVGLAAELTETAWQTMIDVNLTGVWHTAKVAIPHLVAGGRGGSFVLTSSSNGVVGAPMYAHYVAAKHGVIGLMRSLAIELAPHQIRVNALLPGGVATDMISHFRDIGSMAVQYDETIPDDALAALPFLAPSDITDALMFLVSDEAKYVTGTLLPVDGHALIIAARGTGAAPTQPASS